MGRYVSALLFFLLFNIPLRHDAHAELLGRRERLRFSVHAEVRPFITDDNEATMALLTQIGH